MSKILIIEDDSTLLGYTSNLLRHAGYDTICASSGKMGIEIALEEMPDLIVSDIIMAGMDGYKILAELQKDPSFADIPFIFITGKAERADFRKGMDLGADDYLVKPFSDIELLNSIAVRLNKKRLRKSSPFSDLKDTESGVSDKKISKIKRKLNYHDRILLNSEKNPRLVKVDSIKYISAVGDYSHVVTTDSNKFFVRRPMKEWELILPDSSFIRIHRSTIINLEFVQNIEKWFNNIYKVFIKGINKPFIISRRYGSKLKNNFKLFQKK